ncbi:Transposon Tn917 resolvase [Galdieria sulphuraria]|uniref:Resolvase n=1 Tax=Galdieria sulphuraria TaxID=130081 RepID=M2WPM9_GALSU|nr:resolvase [Galdieria sulphuraria]EME25735.1 resolvase [Galdieria sulphuraria]GJD09167.1 Transposon Tn917 resolvase [Galdieria sulphuraria]|eukprot:XP_005702255.1 resolvase [Galdieria sulphuraria]
MNSIQKVQKICVYLRISTNEYKQSFERQEDIVNQYLDQHYPGVPRQYYRETISGVAEKRYLLEKIVNDLKPGDLFVASDLDRIARSVFHLMAVARTIEEKKAFLLIANKPEINTNTPMGKFVYITMSAIAELEHSIILQRSQEGLRLARMKGVKIGPKRKLPADTILQIAREMKNPSTVVSKLAKVNNVSPITIYRYVKSDGTLTEKGFDAVREKYKDYEREETESFSEFPKKVRRHTKEELGRREKPRKALPATKKRIC